MIKPSPLKGIKKLGPSPLKGRKVDFRPSPNKGRVYVINPRNLKRQAKNQGRTLTAEQLLEALNQVPMEKQ